MDALSVKYYINLKNVKHEMDAMLLSRSYEATSKEAYQSLYRAVEALRDKVQEALKASEEVKPSHHTQRDRGK